MSFCLIEETKKLPGFNYQTGRKQIKKEVSQKQMQGTPLQKLAEDVQL